MAQDATEHSNKMQRIGDISSTLAASCTAVGLKSTPAQLPVKSRPRTPTNAVEARDNEAMKSLTLLLGSPLVECWDDRLDAEGQWDGRLVGFKGAEPTPDARQMVAELTAPTDRETVAPTLQAMAEGMPSQGSSATAIRVWMELVWMAVDEFPADVIQQAAKALVRREKWRPTPAELRAECQWLGRKRAALKVWAG